MSSFLASILPNQAPAKKAGLGVRLVESSDGIFISEISPSSPAKDILRVGDQIISIDRNAVGSLNDAVEKIVGPLDSNVSIAVRRKNKVETLSLKRSQPVAPSSSSANASPKTTSDLPARPKSSGDEIMNFFSTVKETIVIGTSTTSSGTTPTTETTPKGKSSLFSVNSNNNNNNTTTKSNKTEEDDDHILKPITNLLSSITTSSSESTTPKATNATATTATATTSSSNGSSSTSFLDRPISAPSLDLQFLKDVFDSSDNNNDNNNNKARPSSTGSILNNNATPPPPSTPPYNPVVHVMDAVLGEEPGGIGVRLMPRGQVVVIEELVPGGAAEQCGAVRRGDILYAVDNLRVRSIDDAKRRLAGRTGWQVTLTLRSSLQAHSRVVTLERTRRPPAVF